MYKFFHAFPCRSGSCMLSKIGLVVKLTIPFLLAAILQVNAASYAQQVSISANNTSLSRIFELLHKQTGYTFLYNSAMISESNPVSISVKKAELKDFLDKCFADQPQYKLASRRRQRRLRRWPRKMVQGRKLTPHQRRP